MDDFFSACLAFEGEQQTFEASDEPVWILGQQYDTRTDLSAARDDVLSRVWLTYRRNFPPLGDSYGTTSDRGWGCMLRCGQMLLAEAGLRRHLGRSWRWKKDSSEEAYLKILRMFEDQPLAPFSLHVMTSVGCSSAGKNIGEWYGPNTVAHLIRRLPEFDVWNNFTVSVASNNVIIVDETRQLSKQSHPNGWDPLLILIPQRLGMNTFNVVYTDQLQRFFRIPQCLGILGGTPSHALFLIGYVGSDVIYLDPHTTQESVSVGTKSSDDERAADMTYHCNSTPRMPFVRLDPSMALCFLCNSEAEFNDLVVRLRTELTGSSGPLEVMDTRPDYMMEEEEEGLLFVEDVNTAISSCTFSDPSCNDNADLLSNCTASTNNVDTKQQCLVRDCTSPTLGSNVNSSCNDNSSDLHEGASKRKITSSALDSIGKTCEDVYEDICESNHSNDSKETEEEFEFL